MADIKSHLRVHYNDVKVTCPEPGCDFSCRAKITLKHHRQAVHTDNRPMYACHVCEERHYKGSDLSKHLLKAHKFAMAKGHSRFRYTKDSLTGLFRLQTSRFESFEMLETVTSTPVRASIRMKKKIDVGISDVISVSVKPEALASSLIPGEVEALSSIIDMANLENIKVEDNAGENILVSGDSVSVSLPILTAGSHDPSDMVSVAMMAAIQHDEDIEVSYFKLISFYCYYFKAQHTLAAVDLKDIVTEEKSGVNMLPVQKREVPEGEIASALGNEETRFETDISLAPVILNNDGGHTSEDIGIAVSDHPQVVQVKLELKDSDMSLLYHEENLVQYLRSVGIDPPEEV